MAYRRARSWCDFVPYARDDVRDPDPLTVYPVETVATGIVDVDGCPIMRSPERIGFLVDEDFAGEERGRQREG